MLNAKDKWIFTIKKYGYLAFLVPLALPYLSSLLGEWLNHPNLFCYLTILVLFLILPILDYYLGRDYTNPSAELATKLAQQPYYPFLTILSVPLIWGTVIFGTYYFASASLSLWGKIGWILSIGTISGGLGIVIAHELIHKNTRIERSAGGLLLALVGYATFKVEHVRGHHLWVATDEDASSAHYNQSLYSFLCQTLRHNFINGWRLEAARLRAKNFSIYGWHNELITWYAITFILMAALTYSFGLAGAVFFILQALVAIIWLEITNYVEHYGLRRKKLPNGRYEPPTEMHSWNSNFLLSSLILFQLQRHADHHIAAKRRYQILAHRDKSPQLPAGYPTMVILALVPALWFKAINPLITLE